VKYWHSPAVTEKMSVLSICQLSCTLLCLPCDTFHKLSQLCDFLVSQVIPACLACYGLLDLCAEYKLQRSCVLCFSKYFCFHFQLCSFVRYYLYVSVSYFGPSTSVFISDFVPSLDIIFMYLCLTLVQVLLFSFQTLFLR
jgi:hypothetical protein